jgi:hypothetical protein
LRGLSKQKAKGQYQKAKGQKIFSDKGKELKRIIFPQHLKEKIKISADLLPFDIGLLLSALAALLQFKKCNSHSFPPT